ncbi:hypothetical protein FK178_07345 [Antarcticibacterium arcticum]|uniref:Uncharacterized protein n=1 Tax=Antarcticibacterium arcticum TaxID=2585771 RepID=A0A5B8YIU0_9FLAO|nr:hypothetical protein [Antarcticibacterium arcticum]QED37551.1 hypothetical protein FK178_07345 [Antarcticibacterium arcticum]
MKKLTYLLFLAIGVTACSVESIDSTENLLTADMKFKSQSSVTITPPDGVLCAGEELTFSVSVTTDKQFQVQMLNDDLADWDQVHQESQGQTGSKYFNVILAEGENTFRYTNQSGGGWTYYSTTFTGIDCSDCDNSLVVDFVCEETKTATFTFTAVEAGPIVIQGGLSANAEITSQNSNVLESVWHQSTGGPSSVTRWVGEVDACEEVTITIIFTGGNGIGEWTAKRGEDLLGSTDAQECN